MAAEIPGRREGGTISQINVTPFVDVMLVLLVIFMVTAPFIQQGVQVSLPQAKGGAIEGKEEPLVVSITKDGKIYLNDNAIELDALGKKLQAIIRVRKGKEVYLRADQSTFYGAVMRAIAEIKEAGIEKLGMITRPPSEKK
jgi:biopolymer transport protein TolR